MFSKKAKKSSIEIEIIPRYSETDQGGVIHHSVYPIYFELGRTELLRANGTAYADLEKAGYGMVVAEINLKYRRPAFYDEKLVLLTNCVAVTKAKINHSYRLYKRDTGVTVAEGSSVLACVDSNGRPVKIPDFLYPEADQA